MDKRFIFRYRLYTIKSWQVTLGGRPGVALELSTSKHAVSFERRGVGQLRRIAKAIRLILRAKKSLVRDGAGARTADRHRWAGVSTPRWTGDPSLRNSAN